MKEFQIEQAPGGLLYAWPTVAESAQAALDNWKHCFGSARPWIVRDLNGKELVRG